GIDHLDVAAILELDVGRQRADAPDPVAVDDDRVVAAGRLAGAVDQGAVADHQGLRGAHGATSVRRADRACRSKLPPNRPGCKADPSDNPCGGGCPTGQAPSSPMTMQI